MLGQITLSTCANPRCKYSTKVQDGLRTLPIAADKAINPLMNGIRTNAAAVMLGISPNTLRSWERRYGFP